MSTTPVGVDVDVLRREIHKTYSEVSTEPEKDFIFPSGRGGTEELGYPQPELSRVRDIATSGMGAAGFEPATSRV